MVELPNVTINWTGNIMRFTVVFHDHIQHSLNRIFTENIVPRSTIEIGAFEGHTTFNLTSMMVNQNPDYKHYVIDPFTASENLTGKVTSEARTIFMENLESFEYKDNIEVLEEKSFTGLIELYLRGIKVDFIYVDGSHFAPDVLQDLVLGFEMLNPGGVILCDDAVSWRYGDHIQDSPKLAIDSFIACNWKRLKVLEMPGGYQVAFQKTD